MPNQDPWGAYSTTPPIPTTGTQAPTQAPSDSDPWAKYATTPPGQEAQTPNPDDWQKRVKPVTTYNGKASVQREDNAVWYGPEQGNQGPGGWFDANGHRVSAAPRAIDIQAAQGQAPIAQSQPTDTQAFVRAIGNTPVLGGGLMAGQVPGQSNNWTPTLAGTVKGALDLPVGAFQGLSHLMDYSPGNGNALPEQYRLGPQADKAVQAYEDFYNKHFDQNISGQVLGQILPFVLSGGTSEAAEAPKILTGAQRLGAIAKSGLKAAGVGGALVPAITPEANLDPNNPDDYSNRKIEEFKGGAEFGGLLGAAGSAIPEVINTVRGVPNTIRRFVSGYKGNLPPEILSNESPLEILSDISKNKPEILTKTAGNIDIVGGNNPVETLKLKAAAGDEEATNALIRLNNSTAKQFGVDTTLGDITQDPAVMAREESLRGSLGSNQNKFKQAQDEQLTTAIKNPEHMPENNFSPEAAGFNAGHVYSDDSPASKALFQEFVANPDNKDVARIRKQFLTAQTNQDIVQANLEAQRWYNQRQVNDIFAQRDNLIQNHFSGPNSVLDQTVDMAPVKGVANQITSPNTKAIIKELDLDNSVPFGDVRGKISRVSEEIQRLGNEGNFVDAGKLGQLKEALVQQENRFLSQVPGAMDLNNKAVSAYANTVAPFNSNSTGIPQILKGEYADKATNKLFTTSNVDQFKSIYNNLDEWGQKALKAEMLSRAEQAATKGGTQAFDPRAWADYVTKRQEQFAEAFRGRTEYGTITGDPSTPELLAHLSSLTKRISVPAENIGKSIVKAGLKLGPGAVIGSAGGPGGTLAGMLAEPAAEGAYNRLSNKVIQNPNLKAWIQKLPVVSSDAELNALAPGSYYMDKNGIAGKKD